jgi:DNA primase
MAARFDNATKEQVRSALNIVDVIGSYVEVRRQGRGFVARCPFHDDRRPSMQVNPERQSWKCWVCDVGGDVFSFVMQREGMSFPEALQFLADRAGVYIEPNPTSQSPSPQPINISNTQTTSSTSPSTPLPPTPSPTSDRSGTARLADKRMLYRAMEWVVRAYRGLLDNNPAENPPEASSAQDSAMGQAARMYLKERGLEPNIIERFQLGFAPNSWSWLVDRAVADGISVEALERIGVLGVSERGTRYDRFRDRLIFPIFDPQSRAIALGGRVLPGGASDVAKYINCSETRLYQKNQTLYGLNLARERITKSRVALVMEGYTDVMMAHQHGIDNAVACCGTALTENHIRLLKRYCDSVVLVLDGDEAGRKRTQEVLELFLVEEMDLRVLTLPEELDPCDYLVRYGSAAMQELIDKAVDALEFKIQTACTGFDPLLDTHRASMALENVLGALSKIPARPADSRVRIRQEQILARLSRQFGVALGEIRRRLQELRERAERYERLRADAQRLRTNAQQETLTEEESYEYRYRELTPVELELLEILVLHAELVPFAIERFPVEQLTTETAKAIFQLYIDLDLEGHALDYASVLSAAEDADLKNVLESITEIAWVKASKAALDAEARLHSLCEHWGDQGDHLQSNAHRTALENGTIDENEQLDVLEAIVRKARLRHGIGPSAPDESSVEN